jgi:hypothetical protein|tara:strand:+ start:162 stop:344 length:183 start_codon:yes stop_codon:yes gene_type:complete
MGLFDVISNLHGKQVQLDYYHKKIKAFLLALVGVIVMVVGVIYFFISFSFSSAGLIFQGR